MNYAQIRRLFLTSFIGFLILTALVGIVSVLSGEFGELQIKILGTCLTISAASICSMACAAFMERRQKWLGLGGIILSTTAASLVIIGVWAEIDQEEFWKTTITLALLTAGFAHGFLLQLPRLDVRHRWVQVVSSASIAVLVVQCVIALWGEIDEEVYYRVMAVIAILVVLETLVIPILIRFRKETTRAVEQLVLKRVGDDLYEDPSGKMYQVTEISSE